MGWREDVTFGNLTVEGQFTASPSAFGGSLYGKPKVYFVSRNVTRSGDGSSWAQAFKTITEAIAKVNQDYTLGYMPDNGRNRLIVIGEGWYSEVGMTLTASDCTIISNASGSRISDGSVLYGSLTAGGWDAGALVPALRITGSANLIGGVGFMNSASGAYPCITTGLAGASGPTDNKFLGCFFPRDVDNAYTYAIELLGNEGEVVENCQFSQSAKTAGVRIDTNGVTNPVNNQVLNSRFCGMPTGILQGAGHNTLIKANWFFSASDDRPGTMVNPLNIVATTSFSTGNYAPDTNIAAFDAGSVNVSIGDISSDSAAANYPS